MSDRPSTEGDPDVERPEGSVDRRTLRETLREHPVELAVLFGSTVTGTTDPESDVDIAVELAGCVERRTDAVMDLLVDLSVALDRNDIDLTLIEDLKPRVGRAAFEHGELLVGDPERAAHHRERFEQAVEGRATDSLRERLDAAIAHVDRVLGEDAG